VTALGAAAIQHSCSGFGLHAAQKPVGLRAVAAVGLKRTLRHSTELLNFLLTAVIPSTAPHHICFFKREDGLAVDLWIVTRNSKYTRRPFFKAKICSNKLRSKSDIASAFLLIHREWCNKKNVVW
jgi:hypothetical protein